MVITGLSGAGRSQRGGRPRGPGLVRHRQPADGAIPKVAELAAAPGTTTPGRPGRRARRPLEALEAAARRPAGGPRRRCGCCSSTPRPTSSSAATRAPAAATRCGGDGAGRRDRARAAPARAGEGRGRRRRRHHGAQRARAAPPDRRSCSATSLARRDADPRDVVRVQARPAHRRRPRARLPVPAQPALGRGAAPADRPRRAGAATTSSTSRGDRRSSTGSTSSSAAAARLRGRGQGLPDHRLRVHRRPAPLGGHRRGGRRAAPGRTASSPRSPTGTSTDERVQRADRRARRPVGRRHRRRATASPPRCGPPAPSPGAITAVVSVADDGGSSGRLRETCGMPAARRPPPLPERARRRRTRPLGAGARAPLRRGRARGPRRSATCSSPGSSTAAGDLAAALRRGGPARGRRRARVLPATDEPVIAHGPTATGRAVVEGQVAVARQADGIERVGLEPARPAAPRTPPSRRIATPTRWSSGPARSTPASWPPPSCRRSPRGARGHRPGVVYVVQPPAPRRARPSGYDLADHVAALAAPRRRPRRGPAPIPRSASAPARRRGRAADGRLRHGRGPRPDAAGARPAELVGRPADRSRSGRAPLRLHLPVPTIGPGLRSETTSTRPSRGVTQHDHPRRHQRLRPHRPQLLPGGQAAGRRHRLRRRQRPRLGRARWPTC